MLSRRVVGPCSWLLVVVLPVLPVMAEVQAAILHAHGYATLNGKAIPESSAVFSGDRIQTTDKSAVTLSTKGTSVVLGAGTLVLYGGERVDIEMGNAVIATTKGMSIRAGELTITPAQGGSAKYQVARTNKTVQVTALEGSVAINDGKKMVLVKSGEVYTLAGGGLASSPAVRSDLAGIAIAVIVLAVAGATAGIIAATRGDDSPSTP